MPTAKSEQVSSKNESINESIEDIYPLSPLQQGLWWHNQLAPEADPYFRQAVYELAGELNIRAFAGAWERVVKRHSILRTTFFWEGLDSPMQIVHVGAKLALEIQDVRGVQGEERDAVQEYLEKDRKAGFDLTEAPLLRVSLLRCGEEEWILVFSFHHLLLDGWSNLLLVKEVKRYYEMLVQGVEFELPPERPYREYIQWLEEQKLEEAEGWWREQLRGIRDATPLPFAGMMGEGEKAEEYGSRSVRLRKVETAVLQNGVRQHQLTVNTMLQGAWALLLARHSGEREVVFGTTVSGRTAEVSGIESMVGVFINTLPVRIEVRGEEKVEEWLRRVQREQAGGRRFQYTPLMEAQRWSEVEAGRPLFESLVVFQNYAQGSFDERYRDGESGEGEGAGEGKGKKGLRVRMVESEDTVSYPLVLVGRPGEELELQIKYHGRRLGGEWVERLLGQLRTIVLSMTGDYGQRVEEITWIPEEERRQVLEEWNESREEVKEQRRVEELFEEQAGRRGEAIAAVFGDSYLSYGELNARANQLANYLREIGVEPEVRVGLFLERSLEMAAGLLGVLKAGGVYVPLDVDQPSERLDFLLRDAEARIVLTSTNMVERLPANWIHTLCLDRYSPDLAAQGKSNLGVELSARHAAYVIYTSGSTGMPKGVIVEHENVTNHMAWMLKEFPYKDSECLLQKTPVAFDASFWEFFVPWIKGTAVVFLEPGKLDLEAVLRIIREQRVTRLQFIPTALRALMGHSDFGASTQSFEQVFCGGEALTADLPQQFFSTSRAQLHNIYGPTETTIISTFYRITPGRHFASRIPIGKPISNTQLYVLDGNMDPVAVGVAGELYIGGMGVARGYAHRADLSAERFVPNPFLNKRGERLYRTGDLVRWLEEGSLEFLGRVDHQVKLRGYRIELEEIEVALTKCAEIEDVVVMVREDQPGNQQLAAYVVVRKGMNPNEKDWRAQLQQRLPEYMVPSVFVIVDEMPLTSNGKIDRKSLPIPRHGDDIPIPHAELTPVEEILSAIWSEVLNVRTVSVEDNFFKLGGHSLSATQVMSRIQNTFGVQFPLKVIFEAPTAAAMAIRVEEALKQTSEPDLPIVPVSRQMSLPLSFAQQRLWFIDQLEPGSAVYNLPAAVRLVGTLNLPALERSICEIVRRHEILRTSFPSMDGQPVLKVGLFHYQPLPLIDLSALGKNNELVAHMLARAEAVQPFELACGPLLRTKLIRLAESNYLLLVTMHHIISDGWSMSILIRELTTLYEAFRDDRPSPLKEVSIQYADFACWQREWFTGKVLEQQLGFWRRQLSGLQPLELPTDNPRPQSLSGQGVRLTMQVPVDLTGRLEEYSRSRRVTLFMTLLAGYKLLLSRYCGQNDVTVGTGIANRNRTETEGLIGLFVNTLVLRSRLEEDATFDDLLEQVRWTMLEAYANQDLPFERLVEELAPERILGRTPLFQAQFLFQNIPQEALRLPGVELQPWEGDHAAAKFDLSLALTPSEGHLEIILVYAAELFAKDSMVRFMEHFVGLLERAVARPDARLWEISPLSEAERRQMLYEWNDVRAEYASERCVHELFEEQVEKRPDATAAVFGEECLTYGELNRRANRLAHYLRTLGVGPDSRVGLCVERSLEMLVGLLGILKAGGGYVPLDPSYPVERLRYVLHDCQAVALLTQAKLRDIFSGLNDGMPVVDLSKANLWTEQPHSNIQPASIGLISQHLAYIIYTSGSTGKPKGVMIEHSHVSRLLNSTQPWFGFCEKDVWTLFHSVAFDFSVWEIWGALSYGGRLIVVSRDETRSPEDFHRLICSEGVTVLNQTPSFFRQLMAAPEKSNALHELRYIIFGGEALDVSTLKPWYQHEGNRHTKLINMYGITETTVHVTYRPLKQEDSESVFRASPIGCRIPDLRIYILDAHGEPAPPGAVGELYVGGAGVARGYAKHAELTAERFVADPFCPTPGMRMYKTGDLGRWLRGGEIEFHGRNDFQVKLRGFRIELGEIEARMAQHPAVTEAVVLACEEALGDKRLVAYVVPNRIYASPLLQLLRLERTGEFLPAARYELPNGMLISHQNKAETEFLYDEIFQQEAYLRHGITLSEDAVVFDVGANIGMFTLFVLQRVRRAAVYAFEPIPPVFASLKTNAALSGSEVRLFNCGLSNAPGTASFVWFKYNTVISGRHANLQEEQSTITTFLKNRSVGEDVSDDALENLIQERMDHEEFTCPLRTLSEIIAAEGIERIDLLKIDVEKSEWEVFQGIERKDWSKIRQLVVEVHDIDGRLGKVRELLESRGYQLSVEQDQLLKATNLYTVYARHAAEPEKNPEVPMTSQAVPVQWSPKQFSATLRAHLLEKLPEYMVPARIVVLEALPLTENGKLDRKRLPAPASDAYAGSEYEAPQSEMELTLAAIWAEVLKLERVGVGESFFDMGGHSLLATQVMSRVRKAFGIELPLRVLFEAPTIAELGARVEQALGRGQKREVPAIIPISREQRLPLSFAQQRLWFLDQLEPGNAVYNMPFAMKLRGRLDVRGVERSLGEIVRRHEVLRTSFPSEGGEPWQRIGEAEELVLEVEDLRGMEEREEEAGRRAGEEAEQAFDLSCGPLLRARLLRLGEQEHVLLVTMHHIVSDGWSNGVLIREFVELYEAYVEGREARLPELAIQYGDFAYWQREWLRGEVLEEQLGYWREQLAEVPMLELQTDYPRPTVVSAAGEQVLLRVRREVVEQVKRLSRKENATLFMTLLGGFQWLLGRYTGQQDVAVGTVIANRNREETERLIGFFVNTLVLRTRLKEERSFRELVGEVRETMLEASAHQDLPFERLVEELMPVRDLGRTPLFQSLFELQTRVSEGPQIKGVEIREMAAGGTLAKFEISLFLAEEEGELRGVLSYARELFSGETMERIGRHYGQLLEAAMKEPEQPLRSLAMLSEGEEEEILRQWNGEKDEGWRPRLVEERIAEQAGRNPEAVAAVQQERWLSYGELNRRAERVARGLRRRGVGPEIRVGVHVGRSLETLIAVLGVMKAGGAYVPLDPTHPQERLLFIVRDSGVELVLTEGEGETMLAECEVPRLSLEEAMREEAAAASCSSPLPADSALGEHLAYVIYTSGSTGVPKGVMVTHESLAGTYAAYEEAYYGLGGGGQTHLQMASFSFDVFTSDFVRSLCSGGRLVLCPRETLAIPERLYELMREEGVEFAEFVPAVLRELVEYGLSEGKDLGFMRLLVCSSDMWYGHEMEQTLRLRGAKTRVINSYGLTECTIDSSWYEAGAAGVSQASPVPIGKPLPGQSLYILDGEMRPVPQGVPGELYVGGRGVARGYLGRPELTAERYVPHCHSEGMGERLYRTGDRARGLLDGNVEMIGRNDNQVKIRGVRIELGEVEAGLAQHPEVLQAAVVVHGEGARKSLVAYVMGIPGGRCQSSDLRAFLVKRVPLAAVPSVFVLLDRFPLTHSGKLDRNALPQPEIDTSDDYKRPRTTFEEILSGIWMDVLGVERVGIDDNFFELGGHSLLATKICARVRKSLGIEVPLSALFEEPTVRRLAERIKTLNTLSGVMLPPVTRCSREMPIPLSFSQQRLWFIDHLDSGALSANVPAVLKLHGSLNVAALRAAVNEIVRRHEVLRTSFPVVDGRPRQAIAPSMTVPVEPIDLRSLPEEQQEGRFRELIEADARVPFNLSIGPVFRVALYCLNEQTYALSLTVHHIASDAWSSGVFVREFTLLYAAFLQGEPSPLPELSLQYADFANWERSWLSNEVLESHINYWRQRLEGCPQSLQLRTDFPRSAVQTFRGAIEMISLSAEQYSGLKQLGRRSGATEFMTLLTLVNVWLFRCSGQRDIVIGTPVSNRNQVEAELLIGFFINTVLFRTNVDGEASFTGLLDKVREDTLSAYAYQALPFEKIVEELKIPRSPDRNPLFQVMFNMEQEPTESLQIAGLEIEGVDVDFLQSRFDLHLGARPENGLQWICTYNPDLFKPSTIRVMLQSLAKLADLVLAMPQAAISTVLARLQQIEQEEISSSKRELARKQGLGIESIRRRTANPKL